MPNSFHCFRLHVQLLSNQKLRRLTHHQPHCYNYMILLWFLKDDVPQATVFFFLWPYKTFTKRCSAPSHAAVCCHCGLKLQPLRTRLRELATFSPLAWYSVSWYWRAELASRLTSMALGFCMAATVPSGTPWSMASLMAITAACTADGGENR